MIALLQWCVVELRRKRVGKQNVRKRLGLPRSTDVTDANLAGLVYDHLCPLIEFSVHDPVQGRPEALALATAARAQGMPRSQCLALGRCLYNRINFKCRYADDVEQLIDQLRANKMLPPQ